MALILNRHLQEGRMLAEGGLMDQPVGKWFAQARAGYIWSLLETTSKPGFNWAENALSAGDFETLDRIAEIRTRQT